MTTTTTTTTTTIKTIFSIDISLLLTIIFYNTVLLHDKLRIKTSIILFFIML